MTEKVRKVVDTIKEAFAVFDAMELPMEERECTLSYDAAMAIVDGFEQLKSAQPQWISVEERLPENDACYLVFVSDDIKPEFAYYYGDGEWLTPDLENLTRFVTHWMPLPSVEELNDS